MKGYSHLENLIVEKLIASTYGKLSTATCVKGDLDALFENMQTADVDEGVLFEFGGGRKLSAPPFNGKAWAWNVDAFYLIRFAGDSGVIEQRVREIADVLPSFLDASRTLGGTAALVSVVAIEKPEPAKINEVPFYWLPITLEVIERM